MLVGLLLLLLLLPASRCSHPLSVHTRLELAHECDASHLRRACATTLLASFHEADVQEAYTASERAHLLQQALDITASA